MSRTLRTTGLSGALLGLLALTLGGCSSSADDQGSDTVDGSITFQTWSLKNATFTPYFEDLITAFEQENPGTDVTWIDQPADGYEDKVLQQAESGELPDVVNLPPEYAFVLADAGLLEDLTPPAGLLEKYVDGGVDAYTFDGIEGAYGLPWYLGTELNYYNTELLAAGGVTEVPTTVDELLTAAEKLAATGVRTISDIPGPKALAISVSDNGTDMAIFEDGEFVFNTPEAVALVERYHALYEAGALTPEALQGAGTANGNINVFNTGTVAWTTAGPNYPDRDLAVNAPNVLPLVEVTPGFGSPPLFVQGVSVSGSSKNTATALAFAEYVTSTENQVAFLKLAPGFFPGTKAGNEDPDAFAETSTIELQTTATALAATQMEKARLVNPPQYTEAMETYAKQQIALAVRGDVTAREALDSSVEFATQNLAR